MSLPEDKKIVAKGLGKRKVTEKSEDMAPREKVGLSDGRAHSDSPFYFAVDEERDEIEHASLMLAHAENLFDDPEKCIPLLRAVIHECDRIGRLRELLEEAYPIDGTACEGALKMVQEMELDEEAIESLKTLTITSELYRIMGDALFRLAFFEEGEAKKEILEAARDRIEAGLDLFPQSASLKMSLARLRIVLLQSPVNGSSKRSKTGVAISGAFDDLISALSLFDNENREKYILSAVELVDLIEKEKYKSALSSVIWGNLSKAPTEDFGMETKLALLKVQLNCIEQLIRTEKYTWALDEAISAKETLEMITKTMDGVEGVNEISLVITHDALKAQYLVLEGCLWDILNEDTEAAEKMNQLMYLSADESYKRAIEIHERLQDVYNVEMPEKLITLKDSLEDPDAELDEISSSEEVESDA